jgi:biotin carboxyl carrier protein
VLHLQAEVSGTVVSVLVENGQTVAPGQALLIIKQD